MPAVPVGADVSSEQLVKASQSEVGRKSPVKRDDAVREQGVANSPGAAVKAKRRSVGSTSDVGDSVRTVNEPARPTGQLGDRAAGDDPGRSGDGAQERSAARVGGVAPMISPPGRFKAWRSAQRRGRQGFVPLSPGRAKRRHQVLPRTVIGTSAMLLAFAVGVGFSGAAFYAYYDNRLAENEEAVASFVDGFDEQFTDAAGAIEIQRVEAVREIREELGPLGDYSEAVRGVVGLPEAMSESVWVVETLGEDGLPVVGTAFAVAGHSGGTALVTSYSTIKASTLAPAPEIALVKGDRRMVATLWSWDEASDVALLVVGEGMEVIPFAPSAARSASLGARVYAVSGLGGLGASASPGIVVDQSEIGLQHTAVVGAFYEGGPLVNSSGQLVGVATTRYRPFGVDSAPIIAAPSVDALCQTLLRCADSGDAVVVELDGDTAEAPVGQAPAGNEEGGDQESPDDQGEG